MQPVTSRVVPPGGEQPEPPRWTSGNAYRRASSRYASAFVMCVVPHDEGEVMRKNTNGSYFVSWQRTTGNGHYAQGKLVPL